MTASAPSAPTTLVAEIAYVEQETGEYEERRLSHRGEAAAFYRSLAGKAVRIGMEATGNDRWFRKLMSELGHELLVGDASAIHASPPREQRTDKRDARHILRLLVENRFPCIWQPSVANEEKRQLLLHRCRLVRMRSRIKNQLDSIAKNEGLTSSRTWVGSFLFDVSPFDPLVLTLAAVFVLILASLASLLPARRAASIDPMSVLRTE